jgi:CHAT domain-containing protein
MRGFSRLWAKLQQPFRSRARRTQQSFFSRWLSSWPSKLDLAGISEQQAQARFQFLRQVLQATADSQGDPAVVNPLLQANLELLDAGLAMVLSAWATESLSNADPNEWLGIAYALWNFCALVQDFPAGNPRQNLGIAVASYEVLVASFRQPGLERDLSGTLDSLGIAYRTQAQLGQEPAANLQRAIAALDEASQIRRQPGLERDLAATLNNLGITYLTQAQLGQEPAANLQRAIAALDEASQILRQPGLERDLSGTLNNLGIAYLTQAQLGQEPAANLQRAIAALDEASQILRQPGLERGLATTLTNLGNAYLTQAQLGQEPAANLQRAIAALDEASQILRQPGLERDLAATLNNLGITYSTQAQLGQEPAANLQRAIAALDEASQIRRQPGLECDLAATLNNLGNAYLTQAQLGQEPEVSRKAAVTTYQEALQFLDPQLLPSDCLRTGTNLGNLAFSQGWWDLAIAGYLPAIAAVQQTRTWATTDQAKQEIQEKAIQAYVNLIQAYINTQQFAKALEVVERSKARNLVELLATRDLYPKGDIPAEVLSQLDRLQREISTEQQRLQNQAKLSPFNPNPDSEPTRGLPRTHLVELLRQRDQLIQEQIQPIDPSFSLAFQDVPLQFSDMQALLRDDHTALLQWYITDTCIHTFITTRSTAQPIVVSSDPQALDSLIAWANQSLTTESTQPADWQQQLTESLQQLAQILQLDQLLSLPALAPCTRVILIPHLFLHLFPLHALPLPQPPSESSRCLLDRFPDGVSYAPSAQLLHLTQQRQRPPSQRFFALQNPTQDLPYTDLEVEVIQQFYQPHSQVLRQSQANRAALDQADLSAAHLLHLSCHGYFNVQSPLSSALLLADCYLNPAPVPPDPTRHLPVSENQVVDLDRCLTLGDLFSREVDLRQCHLATLSACETGKIDFTDFSDEYIGLPSGFLFAGAASVVSSLWSVNDRSTAFLMIQFYKNLQTQRQVSIALNQAQSWLRNSTKAELLTWINDLRIDGLPLRPADKVYLQASLHSWSDNQQPFQEPVHWAAFITTGQSELSA